LQEAHKLVVELMRADTALDGKRSRGAGKRIPLAKDGNLTLAIAQVVFLGLECLGDGQ
jgi:hypothetical protein